MVACGAGLACCEVRILVRCRASCPAAAGGVLMAQVTGAGATSADTAEGLVLCCVLAAQREDLGLTLGLVRAESRVSAGRAR